MEVNGAKIYFEIPIFGGVPITQTTLSSFLVMVILCVAGYLLGRKRTKRPGPAQVLVEKAVNMLYKLVSDTMGPHNVRWAPFIGTIFLSSLLGSLIGMTGFLRSATADLSIVLTWAVCVSILIWYHSIKNNGFVGWLKGFTEPIWVMTPMNIVSEIAQPISMAFRHFGNVVGGSVITSLLYTALAGASSMLLNLVASNGLVVCIVVLTLGIGLLVVGIRKKKLPLKLLGPLMVVLGSLSLLQHLGVFSEGSFLNGGIPFLQVGIPAILSLYFDVFSGFIQAFVFCLLTMVYISNACPPPTEDQEQKPA